MPFVWKCFFYDLRPAQKQKVDTSKVYFEFRYGKMGNR
jgi:hypothetical protein